LIAKVVEAGDGIKLQIIGDGSHGPNAFGQLLEVGGAFLWPKPWLH
jgi:hypothetical protein